MALNPARVPPTLVPLLPLAERWGLGDDFEREAALARASREDLQELVRGLDGVTDADLFGWLSGDESWRHQPSPEYVAVTCLVMAIDSAKLRLQRNR